MKACDRETLLTEVRVDPHTFGHHVRVNLGSRRWGYSFDQTAMRTQGRVSFVKMVGELIAEQVFEDLSRNPDKK